MEYSGLRIFLFERHFPKPFEVDCVRKNQQRSADCFGIYYVLYLLVCVFHDPSIDEGSSSRRIPREVQNVQTSEILPVEKTLIRLENFEFSLREQPISDCENVLSFRLSECVESGTEDIVDIEPSESEHSTHL